MKKFKVALAVGIVAMLAEQSAVAAIQQGQYAVTPMGVYYALSNSRKLENGGGFGVGLAHYFSNRWAMELDLSTFGSKQKEGQEKSVNGSYATLTGLYYFRPGQAFQPYLSFGVGMAHFSRAVQDDIKTQPNLGVGAGVSYFIDKSIALRAGVNDYYNFTNDGNNDISINIGFSFFFGGSKSESAHPVLAGHTPESGDSRIYLRGVVILPDEPAAQGTVKQQDKAVSSEEAGPVVKEEKKSEHKARPAQLPVKPAKARKESSQRVSIHQETSQAKPDYSLYD